MPRWEAHLLAFSLIALVVTWLLPAHAESGAGKTAKGQGQKLEKAYFAAGCFWKTQYIFSKVPGVVSTRVGYEGGTTKNPSYEQVCTNTTGHAETAEVDFDPAKVSYEQLLKVFFDHHDPTTMNRQGPDQGIQYRSAIFCTTPEQKQIALRYKDDLQKAHKFQSPIVTVIQDAATFYPAEEYHQNYYTKHGQVCF